MEIPIKDTLIDRSIRLIDKLKEEVWHLKQERIQLFEEIDRLRTELAKENMLRARFEEESG